jgi:CBS domain containing-hemolysin-like protein
MDPITALVLAAALLGLRAAAMSSDAALGQVSLVRSREMAKDNTRSSTALFVIKKASEDTAAAIRVCQTVALAFSSGLCAYAGTFLHPSEWTQQNIPTLASAVGPTTAVTAMVVATTVVDLVSRSIGATSGEATALRSARGLRWLSRIISPFLRSVANLLELLLAPIGAKVSYAPAPLPLEEIERLLAEEAGKRLDQKAPALIHSIFELTERTARDLMVPRTELVAIEMKAKQEEIVRVMAEDGHSRMPVYVGDVDHIVGVLHARDLVPLLSNPELIVLQDLIRPATFVPWSKRVGDLLRDMQKKRIHMAMVVDEYGGFMGLVTLEDILAEIVGEIGSEYQKEVSEIELQADGSSLVQGSCPIQAFAQHFGVEPPPGEYETVAGFLNGLAGAIPELGSQFLLGSIQLTITDRTAKQVVRVRVARLKKSEPAVTVKAEEKPAAVKPKAKK